MELIIKQSLKFVPSLENYISGRARYIFYKLTFSGRGADL